jgi:hypothetical protein
MSKKGFLATAPSFYAMLEAKIFPRSSPLLDFSRPERLCIKKIFYGWINVLADDEFSRAGHHFQGVSRLEVPPDKRISVFPL